MNYLAAAAGGGINLQATLSASSAGVTVVAPHHPITCPGELEFDDELRCPHATVEADEERTLYCLQHSVAILILEIAVESL